MHKLLLFLSFLGANPGTGEEYVPGMGNWLQNDQIFSLSCSVFLCTVTTLRLPSLGSRVWVGPTTGWPIKHGSEIVPILSLDFKSLCTLLLAILGSLSPPCGQMAGLLEKERAHSDQSHVRPAAHRYDPNQQDEHTQPAADHWHGKEPSQAT